MSKKAEKTEGYILIDTIEKRFRVIQKEKKDFSDIKRKKNEQKDKNTEGVISKLIQVSIRFRTIIDEYPDKFNDNSGDIWQKVVKIDKNTEGGNTTKL